MTDKSGLILNIQRMSTEDGPGIRTSVFFKGCSLVCPWCHNPESIKSSKEIEWFQVNCIGCETCIKQCDYDALTMTKYGISIDREKCILCLKCIDECPGLALEVKGTEWTVQDLFNEVIKDKAYFLKNGGGITLSGGEVLLQADFVASLLEKLKEEDINTAIDTCGYVNKSAINKVFDNTDLFLFDIKLIDELEHKKLTGQSNKLILDNLLYLIERMKKSSGKKLWIRTPIIPNSTDSINNILGIAKFIKNNIEDNMERWELCAFNNLCNDKYERLDKVWEYKDANLISKEHMDKLRETAISEGINENKVFWTGSTVL